MTEELFNQIALRYKIYFATTDLKDIVFTPKTVYRKECLIIISLTYK